MPSRNTYVIYHANCLDGMTSAAIAYQKFGNEAVYLPGVYHKQPLGEVTDADVYLLDFTLKEKPLRELLAKGNRVTIIDHHEDAVNAIQHVPVHKLIYDKQESGASLAWAHFFPELAPPRMVEYAKDYDLWRFKHPETNGFIAWLEQFPLDIQVFNEKLSMGDADYQKAFEIGNPLYTYKMNLVAAIMAQARPCVIMGKSGWMVNGPYPLASVIGNALAKKHGTFALIWSERSDRMVQMSFRSDGTTEPQQIAEKLGGNGHKSAAGVALPLATFQRLIAASDRALEHAEPQKGHLG